MLIRSITVGPVSTNCYIAADDESREGAVIDPGGDAKGIIGLIENEKIKVKYIFLTHGHFDHVLALDEIRAATGAPCVIHQEDAKLLTSPPRMLAAGKAPGPAEILVSGGEDYDIGSLRFSWLHTPGHTPGSCCVLCGKVIFTGDTLFEDDCGRCDLPGGDYGAMLESLRLLAALEGDYQVYPGHDVSTTLERERRMNVNMRQALGL